MKFITENKNKNEATFKFQGLSARSQHWFDLGFDCIEVNFSTREPGLHKKRFQSHGDTLHKNLFNLFQVTIENIKYVERFRFHNDSPVLKYCRKFLNGCF